MLLPLRMGAGSPAAFLLQLALDSYIQLGDICLLDRIFTSRFHHVAFIQPFAEKRSVARLDQIALHSLVSLFRSFFPDVILFRVFGVLAFGFFVSQPGSGKVVCEKGKTKLGSVVDQLYCPLEQPRVRWVGFYSFSSFRSPWVFCFSLRSYAFDLRASGLACFPFVLWLLRTRTGKFIARQTTRNLQTHYFPVYFSR